MSLDEWKTVAEIGAIILAGAWALYGFKVLRHREKASAELEKIDLESKKIGLESRKIVLESEKLECESKKVELESQSLALGLRRVAVVRAEISASSCRDESGTGYV